ncbi:hypothetical protein [Burkholderia gladioli]|uniref:hypothetical protein n=1 Tax=Burkholderia gladioli TaxID=28095 RepID=UPI001FC86438|nr:hypothetical protein [Burkholderia gladioli]
MSSLKRRDRCTGDIERMSAGRISKPVQDPGSRQRTWLAVEVFPARSLAAAYDQWLREQMQEAINDPRSSLDHEAVMKTALVRVDAMRKGQRGKA